MMTKGKWDSIRRFSSVRYIIQRSSFAMISAVILLLLSWGSAAQQTPETINTDAQQQPLRIEETIRGNKEQPKVLSIVPWQVPLKQRIDTNEANWQPQTSYIKPIERSAFLASLKVSQQIKEK